MRLFNAFQIVAAFVAWPFGLVLLSGQTFTGVAAAFYAASALYILAFGAMIACVYHATDDWKL
jgi:hypothetical protein